MGAPQAYLFTPPEGVTDPYGTGIHHSDFARKLRLLNKRLQMPTPDQWGENYYPGREHGITTVWLGTPQAPGSKKITAVTMGQIPEWTVMDAQGNVVQKGWRAILSKCIKARCFTQQAAERLFNTSLEVSGRSNLCDQCAAEGKRRLATSASKLCDTHDGIRKETKRAQEAGKERKWLLSQSKRMSPKSNSFTLDLSTR